MGRSINEIAQELNATGLNQHQLMLLVELLAAKNEEATPTKRSKKPPLIALPADWKPNEAHCEWALLHGKDGRWMQGIADDMRNWAASRGERRACWNGTFSTFMKRALEPRPVQQKLFSGNGTFTPKMIGGGYA
jgi:hypothetical protein